MSIIESLRRLVNPVEVQKEDGERLVLRDRTPRRVNVDADPPTFACRLCGWTADEPRFCRECLAETMQRQAT